MKTIRVLRTLLLAAFLEGSSLLAQSTPITGMAPIPAGSFQMGDSVDGESDAPVGTVSVSAFYMDTNLVTASLWQQVYQWALTNGYAFDNAGLSLGPNYPIETINWYDAVKWCNARSQFAGQPPVYYTDSNMTVVYKTGDNNNLYPNWNMSGYRLPTEAEWEKAARGGLAGQRFPGGSAISESQANYYGDPYNAGTQSGFTYDAGPPGGNPTWYTNTGFAVNQVGDASQVGAFPPNGYGINDMAGNVFEWCWDWYSNSYPAFPLTDPHGPATGTNHVDRGGDWSHYAYECRTAYRNSDIANLADLKHGFRTVLPEVSFVIVTVQANPAGGGVATGGGIFFGPGHVVTNTATPNAGYQFVNWSSNSVPVSTNTTYIFMANTNVALVANFAPILYTVTVSASPAAGGTVSGSGTFPPGASNTVTATVNGNYSFVNWTDNGVVVSTSTSYGFIVNGNHNLVANFTPIIYNINLSASPAAGGNVSGGGAIASGTTNTVTATANYGYTFADWTINGSPISLTSNYTFVVNGNYSLVANFAPINYMLSVSASPTTGGIVSGGGTFPYNSQVGVLATPAANYQFVSWTVNGTVVSTSVTYNFTLTNSEQLVANFAPIIYTISVTASPTNGGTVGGGGALAAGSTNTVTAATNNGYAFVNWTVNGSVVSTSTNYTFIVNGNEALIANFAAITYTITTTASPAAGGIVTGGGTYPQGASVTNTATANAGYLFANWTVNGSVVSTSPTYIFTPTANEALTANFTAISVNYTYTTNNGTITITGYTGPGGAVTIPASIIGLPVVGIGVEAFWNSSTVTSVTIPNTVTNIAEEAFWNSTVLSNITIPNSVTNIGQEAFWNCTSLASITLPSGLTNIGVETFWNCTGLSNVTIPQGVLSIGDGAFDSCYSLASIVIPNSVTNVGGGAFNDCYSLTNVTMGTGLAAIANGVFAGTSLTSVAIPASVTSIGEDAFNSCTGLTSVLIPDSVVSIGVGAFGYCPLTSVLFTGDAPSASPSSFANDPATVYYLSGTTGWNSTFAGLPAVLWNPTIQTSAANFGMKTNKFGFTITGTAGIPVIVQASATLTGGGWTTVQTCTLTNGSIYFADSGSNHVSRFYRISYSY